MRAWVSCGIALCFLSDLVHRIQASSTPNEQFDLNSSDNAEYWQHSDSTTRSGSSSNHKPKRTSDRRLKYPDLYDLIKSTPLNEATISTDVTFDHQGEAIVAKIQDKAVPVYLDTIPLSSSSKRSQRGKNLSEDGEVVYGPENLGRYAKLKLKAEREGRSEEFREANRLRMARRRADMNLEEKIQIGKYEYATKKLNIEALKATNPSEAEKQEAETKARSRIASKKYYHENIESQRQRHRSKYQAFAEALKGVHMYEEEDGDFEGIDDNQSATSRNVLDFDLNDPAPLEEDEGEGNTGNGDIQMMRRGLRPESSAPAPASLPSARKVKHPELLSLVTKIPDQPKNTKRVSHSQIDLDPSTGKLIVQLKGAEDTIELEPSVSKVKEKPAKESSYHRRIREATEQGPEALAALRRHFCELNYAAKQRRIEAGLEEKKTSYYRYVNLVRKKNMAVLEKMCPQAAEEKKRAFRRMSREAQRRYRQKLRDGIPIKKYRQENEEEISGSTAEDIRLGDEFNSMALSGSPEASTSRESDALVWGHRGKRTERMVIEDPVQLQWVGSGTRRERDGKNAQWTSALPEVVHEAPDETDEAMMKWRSIADSILSKRVPAYTPFDPLAARSSSSQTPYEQMNKYQRRLYRAEQRGEVEQFRQNRREWQARYQNRAIEKERKLLLERNHHHHQDPNIPSSQADVEASGSRDGLDSPKLTYYGVRRRRMKEKGNLGKFLEAKRIVQNRSNTLRKSRSGKGKANQTESSSDHEGVDISSSVLIEGGADGSKSGPKDFDLNMPASEMESDS